MACCNMQNVYKDVQAAPVSSNSVRLANGKCREVCVRCQGVTLSTVQKQTTTGASGTYMVKLHRSGAPSLNRALRHDDFCLDDSPPERFNAWEFSTSFRHGF